MSKGTPLAVVPEQPRGFTLTGTGHSPAPPLDSCLRKNDGEQASGMPHPRATGWAPLRGMDIRLWGFGLVCCGEGDGDGRRPVDDALVIRHRASPPPLLRSSGDSGVPGRGDATGPLPLNARRTTDWSGPDVRDGSYGVGCTVLRRRTFHDKGIKGPGSSCRAVQA